MLERVVSHNIMDYRAAPSPLLPNDGFFFDRAKFKTFADDTLNVAKIMISAFDTVENIVGKVSLFSPKRFKIFSLPESLKIREYVVLS